jgi:hypothetical protein
LTKDSTLTVNVWLDPELGLLDSLQFKGLASSICQYYQDKMKAFPESGARTAAHTLSSEETQTYHQKLDSLSLQETLFLTTKKLQYNLPEWFVKFESSEISYQKAYLKITNQRDRAEIKMDTLKIDNPDAVFSYYYYLYLNAYFQQLVAKKDEKTAELQQLALADSLLKSETRDVYFSRSLFAHLQRKEITEASEIFEKFPKFTQQKYFRFLNWEITRSKKALESSSTY